MDLADLFDVELQVLRDQDAAREELRRRDRRIGLTIGADERVRAGAPAARREVLRDWVRAIHQEERRESTGARFVQAQQALGWLLVVLGLSSGAGTAASVLSYDGTRPVNVVHFLAVFVALQLLLLALFLLSATLWRLRARVPALHGIQALLRLAVDALASLLDRRLTAERRSALKAARGKLRASRIVYGDVERWLLVSLAQRFGLSFNLGALASCLYLVAFSDLAFAWQTTMSWTAESFHGAISALAAPWSWIYPDGLPSLEVVRASRYFRLGGTFGGPARAEMLGQWWRFLVLALLVYGLIPRLISSIYAAAKLRGSLARLRLDHADLASVLERLSSPIVQTRAQTAEPGALEPLPRTEAAADSGRAGDLAAVVIWGDVPIEASGVEGLIATRFGWEVGAVERAGVDETTDDDAAIAKVSAARGGPIVVLVEAFESPTREARAFVQRLRRAAGKDRPIVVGLLDASADPASPGAWTPPARDDRAVWEKHMSGLGDPYLRVEALVEEPEG